MPYKYLGSQGPSDWFEPFYAKAIGDAAGVSLLPLDVRQGPSKRLRLWRLKGEGCWWLLNLRPEPDMNPDGPALAPDCGLASLKRWDLRLSSSKRLPNAPVDFVSMFSWNIGLSRGLT